MGVGSKCGAFIDVDGRLYKQQSCIVTEGINNPTSGAISKST